MQRSVDQTTPETAKRPATRQLNRIDKGCVVPDPLTVPVHDLCMPNSKAPAETAQQTVLKITHLEIKRALRQAAYVRGIARSMNMHSLFPTQQGSAVMTGLFEKKWRCISRTVTYVGWSLFWLLALGPGRDHGCHADRRQGHRFPADASHAALLGIDRADQLSQHKCLKPLVGSAYVVGRDGQ